MVLSPSGEPRGVAMFFKDLTPIEHEEEQVRLRERLTALGQMAASLAHEIRNPLAAIEVNCSLLRRRLLSDSPDGELLEKIASEVKRLNGSVSSSLDYVRPMHPEVMASDLLPVIDEALSVAAERRGKPGLLIERIFPRVGPHFLMDPSLLRQAFVNLALNALEAMGSAGSLTVSVEVIEAPGGAGVPYRPTGDRSDPFKVCDRFALVRFADTGPGIAEDRQDRIFYPFFTTKAAGSGVGLAMVKKIVDSHRGVIDLDSAPGQGATFSIRLPMIEPPSEVSRS
jgi:signal transduction histidine kinase